MEEYFFIGNYKFVFNSTILLDDKTWVNITEWYPTYGTQGNKDVFYYEWSCR
jgi:hypothetical protein